MPLFVSGVPYSGKNSFGTPLMLPDKSIEVPRA
jgi:hypothetical protein